MLRPLLVFFVLIFALSATQNAETATPAVRISYGHFLEDMVEEILDPDALERNPPLDEKLAYLHVARYQKLWDARGPQILVAMEQAVQLEFRQNTIDVYVMPRRVRPFSNPLVLSAGFSSQAFVPALAHEISHRLLTDNTKDVAVGEIFLDMYPDEPRMVRNHVIVFAILSFVFDEVLQKPEMLATERTTEIGPYRRAWEIVDQEGYQKILTRFRSYYE